MMKNLFGEFIGSLLGHKAASRMGFESDVAKAAFSVAGGRIGQVFQTRIEELVSEYVSPEKQADALSRIKLDEAKSIQIGFIAGRSVQKSLADAFIAAMQDAWGLSEHEAEVRVRDYLRSNRKYFSPHFREVMAKNFHNTSDLLFENEEDARRALALLQEEYEPLAMMAYDGFFTAKK